MLTLVDAAGPYQLPTHWGEITGAQFNDLDRNQHRTVEQRASYFAGRPIQVNGYVADALAFLLHAPPRDASTLAYPQDLGQETFLQVESIRALLLAQPLHACYGDVYGTFVARALHLGPSAGFAQAIAARRAAQALAWPVTDTYPAVAHCLAELQRLGEAFAGLAAPDDTEAGRRARAAGADRLGAFGHFGVATAWAERFGCSVDEAYQTPWQTVALWLLRERTVAEIQDKLSTPPA